MKKIKILISIVYFISIVFLVSVDWKIAVGVVLFGTGMNMENKFIPKNDQKT